MAAVSLTVDDKAVRKMLAKYNAREMHNRLRRGVRAGAAVYRAELRSQARSRSDIPRSFAKTRTKSSSRLGGDIYTNVRPVSPLLSIFEGGAGGHSIGQLGQALSNRDTGFFARGPVMHPGMRAHPLLGPIFASQTGAARVATATATFGAGSLGLLGLGDEG